MPESILLPVYWIFRDGPGRLATLSRPRGPEWLKAEIAQLREQRIDTLVSLLTDDEVHDLFLDREKELCVEAGIEFIRFPIIDRMIPHSTASTLDLALGLQQRLHSDRTVAIHCRGGIGRSSLIAACVLVLEGIRHDVAFQRISLARGWEVPNTEQQREWVANFEREVERLS